MMFKLYKNQAKYVEVRNKCIIKEITPKERKSKLECKVREVAKDMILKVLGNPMVFNEAMVTIC